MKKDPYRYRELISELNELVSNGDLLPVDEIQILRDISGYRDGYHPIIAWYYNREDMADIADEILESLEDLDGRATFRHADPEEVADMLHAAKVAKKSGSKAAFLISCLFPSSPAGRDPADVSSGC